MDTIHSAQKLFLSSNAQYATYNDNNPASCNFSISPLVLQNTDESSFVIGLESASIPLSFYAVNNTNNTFELNFTTYQLVNGNYSSTSLITALNTLTGYTWSYSLDTNKLKIVVGAGVNTFGTTANTASAVLGFEEGGVVNDGDELPNVLNLTYTTGIQIRLDNITTANQSASALGGNSILTRLPITTPAYTILQFFNPNPFYTTISNRILSEISISLVDDNEELLNLNGFPNWFLTLRIDYHRAERLEIPKTPIQQMRVDSIQPLLDQQEEDIKEIQNNPIVKENTNRIQKVDLVNEIIQRRLQESQLKEQKRPLKRRKIIRRK